MASKIGVGETHSGFGWGECLGKMPAPFLWGTAPVLPGAQSAARTHVLSMLIYHQVMGQLQWTLHPLHPGRGPGPVGSGRLATMHVFTFAWRIPGGLAVARSALEENG